MEEDKKKGKLRKDQVQAVAEEFLVAHLDAEFGFTKNSPVTGSEAAVEVKEPSNTFEFTTDYGIHDCMEECKRRGIHFVRAHRKEVNNTWTVEFK